MLINETNMRGKRNRKEREQDESNNQLVFDGQIDLKAKALRKVVV